MSSAPATALTPVVTSCNVIDVVSALRAAWQEYQAVAVERLGLAFGRRLYELRIASSAQGNHSGKGFLQLLQQAGIPQRTAYYWIHSYELSIGERQPKDEKNEKKTAGQQITSSNLSVPVTLTDYEQLVYDFIVTYIAHDNCGLFNRKMGIDFEKMLRPSRDERGHLSGVITLNKRTYENVGGGNWHHATQLLRRLGLLDDVFQNDEHRVIVKRIGPVVEPCGEAGRIKPSQKVMRNCQERGLTLPACGEVVNLYSKSGTLLVTGYERIVFGEEEPYVEMTEAQMVSRNLRHINRPRPNYYHEFRSVDEANVKVYYQKRTVAYADYRVGMWYISPDDLVTQDGRPVIRPAGITVNAGGQ
jgi:hypothetical protein